MKEILQRMNSEKRKKGIGFYVALNSLGHIATR